MRALALLLFALPTIAPLVDAATAPRCPYADLTPTARQVLQQIDRDYPRCVRQACTGERRYYAGFFELDSCFMPRPAASSFGEPNRQLSARMSRGLAARYVKPILKEATGHTIGSVQVLEYGSPAGAQAAQAVMDSIVASCRGRGRRQPYDERCIGLDVYRVARRGSCLIRFNMWVEDPILRSTTTEVAAAVQAAFIP